MKVLLSGLLASFVVMGCTHSKVQPPTPAQENVKYLKAGDREPAQTFDLIWHPARIVMDVTKANDSQSFQAAVTQERVWRGPVTTYQDAWVEREREVPGMCSRPVCPSASGQSELWTAYFNAPAAKRADALAKAIEGIGEVSSKALVAKGYFTRRPTSWQAFESEIRRAADAGVIKKNVATMVTENYQAENMNKLGYRQEACTFQKYSCNKIINERVLVKVPRTTIEETRSITYQRDLEIRVRVMDAKLLSFEKDQLIVVVDENGRVAVDSTGFNRYTVVYQSTSGNFVNIDLKADSRVLRDLPGNVVLRDSYELIGGKPTFTVELDPKYMMDSQLDPNAQFVIDYQVNVCEYGWSGTCGLSSWKKISATTAVMTNPRLTAVMDVPVKNKSQITYRISRQNSDFFNAKSIYERSSDSVKMPKF